MPQSKPIWFTELGCPAVDKGANQPNVFVDPKSSESRLPYFSQRHARRLHAAPLPAGVPRRPSIPTHPGYIAGANPVSTVYGGRMVDLDRIHVYAWDARPYPAFPADTDAWGDGANWRLGHWLTGRLASAPLGATVAAMLDRLRLRRLTTPARSPASLAGLVIDRVHVGARGPAAAGARLLLRRARERRRASSSPIAAPSRRAAELDADASGRGNAPAHALATLTRAQETELPASAKLTYIAAAGDYPAAVEEARRLAGRSGRVAIADLPLVLDAEQAAQIAEVWLFEAWAARERASFALPPSRLALEPGDVVALAVDGRSRLLRITEIGEHGARDIEARGIDPEVYAAPSRRAAPAGGGAGRHRRPAARRSSSTCRCCAATSRRTPATSPPRRTPGPAPSPSTARRRPPASC